MAQDISCLCGQAIQAVLLDPSADHTVLDLCHCNACRETSGLLFTAYYRLQTVSPKLDRLREYQQSDIISRYFCRTCGAHVFAQRRDTRQYYVAAGVFTTNPPAIRSIRHWQTADTRDGGLSCALPSTVENVASGCLLSAGAAPSTQNPDSTDEGPERSNPDSQELPARCHCGGVSYYVRRPDSTSTEPWSPWPDLVVPYYSQADVAANTADVKWWLQAENSKYMAGTCACPSCRLATGFPIQVWSFIPKSNLRDADRSPLTFKLDTLQRYNSSPGVYREFCNRCGATVFWHCDLRPLLIDVSIGLLRADSGARAEEWLQWCRKRVSFAEMAQDQAFVQSLEAGLLMEGLSSTA